MTSAGSKLDDLRFKLAGLSQILGGEGTVSGGAAAPQRHPAELKGVGNAAAPPAPSEWQRQRHARSTAAVLQSANLHARDAPLGGLLQTYRDAEAQWLKDKGKLMLAAKSERARAFKAEGELRRVQEQLAFRVGEVKHLKAALRERDTQLADLQDRLRGYELEEGGERTAAETVRQAEAERDELREAMQQMLERLGAANAVIGQADATIASMEAQVAAAAAARQEAEEAGAAARAETEVLRRAVSDLQWKCGLLQQLSDLTLKQNDEKTETLRQLLASESMLDAGEDGDGCTAPATT